MSAKRTPLKSTSYQTTARIPWTPTPDLSRPTSLDSLHQPTARMLVHGTHTHDGPETSDTNPNPAIYYYCAYHGFNLSHHGYQCRVMANGDGYTTQQKQATLPSDCTPRGNEGRSRTSTSVHVPEILGAEPQVTSCSTSEGGQPDQPVYQDQCTASHGLPATSTTS
jgi:hypothetical protein